jgi:hypothetical protein
MMERNRWVRLVLWTHKLCRFVNGLSERLHHLHRYVWGTMERVNELEGRVEALEKATPRVEEVGSGVFVAPDDLRYFPHLPSQRKWEYENSSWDEGLPNT